MYVINTQLTQNNCKTILVEYDSFVRLCGIIHKDTSMLIQHEGSIHKNKILSCGYNMEAL